MACTGTCRGGRYKAPWLWRPVAPASRPGWRAGAQRAGGGSTAHPGHPPGGSPRVRPPLPGAPQASSGFQLQRISVSWVRARRGFREPGHLGPGTRGSQPLSDPHRRRARILGPLSTSDSNVCWERPLRTAVTEAGRAARAVVCPEPSALPGLGQGGRPADPEFKPRFQRRAVRRPSRPGRPASSPRRALHAVGGPGAGT